MNYLTKQIELRSGSVLNSVALIEFTIIRRIIYAIINDLQVITNNLTVMETEIKLLIKF